MTVPNGVAAPGFELPDQHGAPTAPASYRGRAVVVMFYPYAFSRVCSGELRGVQERLDGFQSDAVQVLAVSCDPVFSLRAYADHDGLTFPLLSDFWPHGEVAQGYGVLDARTGSAERSTFILDGDGVVRWQEHSPRGQARDLDTQLRVVDAL